MRTRLVALILLLIVLTIPSNARADIAPPAQPPGSNLQPGVETTQVRMLAETVLLDVQPGASSESLGVAHVTADFTMHNLGPSTETMAARFPIAAGDGRSAVNEISNLRVRVNGSTVPTRRTTGKDPNGGGAPVPWAEFDVTFPSGKDTAVEVQYTVEATGEYPFVWFKYILSTGAGWMDSIGSIDIIVQLPYTANGENTLLDTPTYSFGTTKGGILNGRSARWHFSDLEPTTADNFEVHLVMPSAWESMLMEQQNVASKPRDGEAWGRLAKVCKEMAFSSRGRGWRAFDAFDPGAMQLYQQSLQAYDKAVTLLPKDALWHAGYADLLGYHAYYAGADGVDTREEAVDSLKEIQLALQLAPDDPTVQDIAYEMLFFFPDGVDRQNDAYVFNWLTATPLPPTPVLIPTEVAENLAASPTPEPTSTPTPRPQPTTQPASPTPSSSAPLPVCGSALVLPLVVAGLLFQRYRGDLAITRRSSRG